MSTVIKFLFPLWAALFASTYGRPAGSGGGGGGTVLGVTNGNGSAAAVNNTDPTHPVITTTLDSNAVALNNGASQWSWSEWVFLQSKVPQLTGCKSISLGTIPNLSTASATTEPSIEGGGLGGAIAANQVLSQSIFQTMLTGKWGFSYKGKLGDPATVSRDGELGLQQISGGATAWILFGTIHTRNATNWELWSKATGSLEFADPDAPDALTHSFEVTFDGTTLTVWKDHVSKITTTSVSTILANQAMQPYITANAAGTATATDFAWCYIPPT
jgi:hypothetical protein